MVYGRPGRRTENNTTLAVTTFSFEKGSLLETKSNVGAYAMWEIKLPAVWKRIKSKSKSFLTFREELATSVLSIQKKRLQLLFFEDGGTKILLNTVYYLPVDVVSYPRRTIFIATVVRTPN